MKSKSWPRLFSRTVFINGICILILLTTLSVLANPASADSPMQEELPPFIPDGKWVGAFSGSDQIFVADAIASATFKGTLSFEVLASAVTGDFQAKGTSESVNSQANGSASFTSTGLVQGTAQEPEIFPTATTMNFKIFLNGSNTPFEFQSKGAGSGSLTMTLKKISCNEVSGDFDVSTLAFLEKNNALTIQLKTDFNAVRVGGIYSDDPDAYQSKLAELQDGTADFLLETMKTKSLDGGKLWNLVDLSMGLTNGIISDNSCDLGNGIDRKYFHTVISNMIGKLIDLAYDHPEWFNEYQMNQITVAANAVGTIGSGAEDPAAAKKYEAKLQTIVLNKLKALDHPNTDCDALYALSTVGYLLPDSIAYGEAYALMGKYQCSGSI